MRGKICTVLVLLILTAVLPMAASRCSAKNRASQAVSTADTPENPKSSDEILCALTAGLYKNSYSAETVKAAAILMNTDYRAKPDSFGANDFLYEENASGNMKDVYSEIRKAAESVKNKTLRKKSEVLFIPFSETSNGTTYKNVNYKYLHSVASPWDCYAENYDENAECVGVSLSGIDYLCKNGCSAEEALLWYLPDFEIQTD